MRRSLLVIAAVATVAFTASATRSSADPVPGWTKCYKFFGQPMLCEQNLDCRYVPATKQCEYVDPMPIPRSHRRGDCTGWTTASACHAAGCQWDFVNSICDYL